jgi:hypothetical protein
MGVKKELLTKMTNDDREVLLDGIRVVLVVEERAASGQRHKSRTR